MGYQDVVYLPPELVFPPHFIKSVVEVKASVVSVRCYFVCDMTEVFSMFSVMNSFVNLIGVVLLFHWWRCQFGFHMSRFTDLVDLFLHDVL